MKIRGAVLWEQGHQPDDKGPLVIEEVDLGGPGPGELLVRIEAAGLCHSDLSAITGDRPRTMPAVIGHEAVGRVEALGDGVTEPAVGDRVVMVFVASCGTCGYCGEGRPNLCQSSWAARTAGTLQTGGRRLSVGGQPLHHYSGISAFAEHAVVVPASVVRIDPEVPPEVAAIFGCAVATGVGAVVNTAKVEAGSAVAVVGLGGVGLSALLGAMAVGAGRVAAIDTNPAKLELARSLGATDTFDALDPDCAAKVIDAFDGGVQYALEMAGVAPAVELAWTITQRGGTTVTAGLPKPTERLSVPLSAMVADEKVLRGSYMGSCVPRRDIPRYVTLYRQGRLPVDRLRSATLTLDEINVGFTRLAAGTSVRDIVVM
jgi:alcohol dehydrogenase